MLFYRIHQRLYKFFLENCTIIALNFTLRKGMKKNKQNSFLSKIGESIIPPNISFAVS